ncbi:plasmid replication initiation protein, partial [Alkalibacillus filiformis]
MARKNGKQQMFSYENSIQKSNELSMAKLSQGLTLNQMQLLAFAIYSTQQDGKTEFNKADFEKKFALEKYQTKHAQEDVPKLGHLSFCLTDLEEQSVEYWNVFQGIKYKKGLFTFKWNEEFVPHILELKEKFVTTDLTITSQFRSSFSWTLYDYLKGHYGYWRKSISKEALMKLFGVENVKSYQNNTGLFKRKVLDFAINEINKYTEIEVRYNIKRKGRAIAGFELTWSLGENLKSATKKQIKELRVIAETIESDYLEGIIEIDNKEDRQRAIEIVRQNRDMLPMTQDPICITYKKAD